MAKICYFTICFVTFQTMVTVLGFDCPYKVCSCTVHFIQCGGLGFKTIPPLVAQSYEPDTNIIFDANQITTIPAGSLPSGLQVLSLWDNPITTIDDNAFDGSVTTLQSLVFSTAHLSRIPDAMLHLKTLWTLELYDSVVGDWNVDVMKNLGSSLKTLVLSNVSLTAWPDWIEYFVHMTELSVVNCLLTTIPDDALDKVINSLTSLTLTGNRLTLVPKSLSKLTVLQLLYLDHNRITDTTWLPHASKVLSLSLNNNNIFNASQLSQVLLPYAANLSNIDITNNHLTAIPDLHFLKFEILDLSYNMIVDPLSGFLPPIVNELNLGHNILPSIPSAISNLKYLSKFLLPSNNIKEIEGTKLPTSVAYFDLGYNLITEITDTSFPQNSSIQTLYLNNNPIMIISFLAFQNLPNLVEMDLGNTRLTRLPLALSSLKKLNMLDLSGIQGLVCTCMEKSLGPWIKSLSPETLWGECGRMSIHDFFWILSPSCPDK